MPKEAKDISENTRKYWAVAQAMIDTAGDYAAAIKLRANLLDEATAHKVRPVLTRHFGGSMRNLDDAIRCRQVKYYAKVEKFNIQARANGVYTVRKPDALLNLLLSEKKRRSYRDKIKRRLQKDQICSLQEFELKARGQK